MPGESADGTSTELFDGQGQPTQVPRPMIRHVYFMTSKSFESERQQRF